MNKIKVLAGASLFLSLGGCAGQNVVGDSTVRVDNVQTSGFLSDYSVLREGEKGEAALVYWNEAADLASYNAVIVEPVSLWLGEDSPLSEVDPKQRKNLADELHSAVVAALGEDFEITDTPGPNTMRIRIALTDAEASAPVLDTVSTYIPQARLLQSVFTLGSDTAGFVGEASAEAEVRDAVSGTLLAAGVDRRAGTKSVGGGSFSAWGDVRRAFKAWSDQFAQNLQARQK